MDDDRPNPDTLLAAISEDKTEAQKGKLKIFLGAAPGVGKTYAMLEAGHAALKNNVNMLVGIIETHGRTETEELLEGLPLAPRKDILYNNKTFKELDIDAIIKMKPQLVLVDELPHRNTPGSANSMRYQDIVNLLDAGIDVYTTVNVQHLESINDEIYQITGIKVKATVPDSIFELAHETVVIDITPEELLERLKAGKVYIPEEAVRAIDNFFTKSNISALRAIALQVAAKSISRKIISYKQTHGINDPWAVMEKVLVCITDSSFTPSLVRSAKRIAALTNAELIAIHIESPFIKLSKERKQNISNHKRYAEYLGAEVATISSPNISKGIIRYAVENNITHIVLSKSVRSRLSEFLLGSVVNDVIRASGKISVHVLNERPKTEITNSTKRFINKFFFPGKILKVKHLYAPLILSIFVGLIGYGFQQLHFGDNTTIILLFLIPAIFSAYRYGFQIALLINIVNTLAFDLFFVEPYFSLNVMKSSAIISLLVFLIVSFIISRLTYVLREQLRTIAKREKTTTAIFNFSKKISDSKTIEELLSSIVTNINKIFGMDIAVFMPEDENIKLSFSCPEEATIDTKDTAALNWAWKYKAVSGCGTNTLTTSSWFFCPLKTSDSFPGIIGVKIIKEKDLFDPETYDFFQSLADQSALAISRFQLLTNANMTK